MWVSAVAAAMVATEFTEMAISTMMKAAMSRGMSQFVYMFYSNAFALFILIPSSLILYREGSSRTPPKLSVSSILKIFLLGLLSLCLQMFINTGIKYSSPALSAAMIDLTPAFTFLLAVIFRMENLECKLQSSRAKAIGTIISVGGALIVTLYKGQPITSESSSPNSLMQLISSNWVIGGILCAAAAFCLALLYIVQTWILKDYPSVLMTTWIACFFVTVLSAIVTLIAEKDLNAWIIKPDIELIAIVCSAVFAVSIRSVVHTWACGKKGPVYTSMFKPLGMIIATFLGVSFLGDTLYLGSVIGGVVIAFGFYTVMWGKAQEEKMAEEGERNYSLESSSCPEVPLLRSKSLDV